MVSTSQSLERPTAGWSGKVVSFIGTEEQSWLQQLQHHLYLLSGQREQAEESQIRAWRDCFAILQASLRELTARNQDAENWFIAFEYELPRERGRRPDVVLLTERGIIVLEFKGYSDVLQAHLDQVSAYARDLQHYHEGSHGRPVHPVLVLTNWHQASKIVDGVVITGPKFLGGITDPAIDSTAAVIDPSAWLEAGYAPLPSLVAAARTIFRDEPLPQIRRAQSAGIEDTIRSLVAISEQARAENGRHLALVTGVPGAGKTLVGLQFVYTHRLTEEDDERTALFLSGNGPLVKVLQHALKSGIFVQDVHGFLVQYGGTRKNLPREHIWVYDEAQRAWDAERVQEKRGHPASEPEDFLRLGERMNSWAMMVGLIGEGQEIHLGEESGLQQWNDAIGEMPSDWIVHCPNHVSGLFTNASSVEITDSLNLSTSLRSHLAEDVQSWVRHLLNGNLDQAATTARQMRAQGFDAYITRDLGTATAYVRERYNGQIDKRFGLLASSKAKNVEKWGVNNTYTFTRRFKDGPWFNDDPTSPFSCCALHDVATEFQCQGLELDMPILAWGDDLRWGGDRWFSPPQVRSKAHDPHQLRVNSYRVLLSRGRDGMIAFVPPESLQDTSAEALVAAGLTTLN